MRLWLSSEPPRRALVVAAAVSLLLHLLAAVAVYLGGYPPPQVVTSRGEPLLVDIIPERPAEPAPRGIPGRAPGPERRAAAPPRVASVPAPRPVPPAPPQAVPPVPPPVAPAPSPPTPVQAPEPAPPPQVAKAPPPEPAAAPSAARPEPVPARPEGDPGAARPPLPPGAGEPRVALGRPRLDLPPGMLNRGQGGGGLRGGRGGAEGEPIPLDTPDPKYQDYFNQLRDRIKSKWVYPREAGDRGIGGQLLIEFHIAKDGRLQYIELRRSSGVEILDDYAMRAIQLADPYPPVPDAIAKRVLAVSGLFNYQIIGNAFVNQFLR